MKWTRWIVRHPWWTLLILTLATFVLMSRMGNLRVETDIGAALPKDLPVKRLYDMVGEKFPSKDVIFIALEARDRVFTPDVVQITDQFTDRLARVQGVYDVISPTNVSVIQGTEEGIEVVPALQADPRDPQVLETLKQRLLASDFVGNLVSKDEKAFGLLVLLKKTAVNKKVAAEILSLTDSLRSATSLQVYATGRPVLEYLLAKGLGRDVHVFFTLVILVVIAILALSFRSFRGVLLPFTVVIVSVLWTFGFMAWVGIPFSHSTEFLPVLLISIGIADGIHILHMYYHLRKRFTDKKELVLETMRQLNLPVIMTSLTTAVAFLALGFAGFTSLKQLGISVAFGVLVAMVFSLVFIPAMLAILPLPKRAIQETQLRWLHNALAGFGRQLVLHKGLVTVIMGVVVLFFVLGIPKIKVENFTIENFPKNHEARRAYELISAHFSGPEVVTAVIRGRGPGALKEPALLKEMDAFKSHLLKDPAVGNVTGLQDLIKRMNQVLHGGDPQEYRIPDSIVVVEGQPIPGREVVAQYLALYQLSSRPGQLERMVTPDYDMARMDIFIKDGRRTTIKRIDTYAKEFIRKDFRHAEEVDLTGAPEILLTVNDMVVSGQTRSIFLSLFLVFLLVVIAFRSVSAGFYGIIPLTFALLVNFGLMGYLGIYASLENMVTSNIAIGVGVDYMIHFIHRFRRFYKATQGNVLEATVQTMDTSGVAILLNALAVAIGFATIMASMFRAVSQMGFLISVAMISTCVAALTFLPVLLSILKPKFLSR